MSKSDSSLTSDTGGLNLWVLWVFILGFFAGFLVFLVAGDKIKGLTGVKVDQEHERPIEIVKEVPPAPSPEVVTSPPEDVSHSLGSADQDVVMTKAMRNRLLTFDFMTLLQDAEIRRYRYQGEMRGIILNKIRTGSIYEKVGFKNGDIIESINGIALADLERRKEEMRDKLPGAANLEFRVRRDEKIKKIRIKIADPGDQ